MRVPLGLDGGQALGAASRTPRSSARCLRRRGSSGRSRRSTSGCTSLRNARPSARQRSSSAGSSHSSSGWTMKRASRPASGECSGPNRRTAPPQATMKSCDGPAGSSVARRTSASIAVVGQVDHVLGRPVVAVARRVVDRALEVRVAASGRRSRRPGRAPGSGRAPARRRRRRRPTCRGSRPPDGPAGRAARPRRHRAP